MGGDVIIKVGLGLSCSVLHRCRGIVISTFGLVGSEAMAISVLMAESVAIRTKVNIDDGGDVA